MNCPTCPSQPLVMSERQGIEIDYCPKCRGVWLDRGELDKIIERSSREEITPVSPPPARPTAAPQPPVQPQQPIQYQQPYPPMHDSDYAKYHYKRRKSWLGELFD